MAVRRPDPGHGRGAALVDETYDLAWWLGVDASAAAAVIGDAIYEVGGTDWRNDRELEVALLGVVAARALDSQDHARLRSLPHLTGRAFHPSATALAPAGSVDGLAHAAREVLALLPPDDAAMAVLSIRFEVEDAELAVLLRATRRRSSDLAGRALAGFRAVAAAVLLWRGGDPTCAGLLDLVELTGVDDIRQGAGLIVGHAERCRTCRAALWRVTEITAALATSPLVTAPAATATGLSARLRPLLARGPATAVPRTGAGAAPRPRIEALVPPAEAEAGLAVGGTDRDGRTGAGSGTQARLAWTAAAVALIVAAVLVVVLLL